MSFEQGRRKFLDAVRKSHLERFKTFEKLPPKQAMRHTGML
jgi:hypothetical protein